MMNNYQENPYSPLRRRFHQGYRRNASGSGQLYASSCYWFIVDPAEKWRLFYTDWGVDLFNLLCAMAAFFAQLASVYKSFQEDLPQLVSRLLAATVTLYTIPIIVTTYIIHMTNIRAPVTEAQAMYYCEVGWSLICACIAVVLTGVGSYIYLMEHRLMRERQLSQKRRKQIHNAMMSSCREEVAMAIRARMTVL
ncbi:hypothetical protein Y032_0091g2478 [Ancylostoma ceylanicum]|uniref:Uncharacterized protein n=1 Tax=Ancylostoma ceylanicum TaxID=53326 RepID=A0A016TMY0_9BILA|nr:hypothetical protein Y032_0091g2478 [Ancylostoma ceylanicum]